MRFGTADELREFLGLPPTGAGPTGKFPEGKMRPDDKGELAVGVTADVERRLVLIDFGTYINWLGAHPEATLQFARILIFKSLQAAPELAGKFDELFGDLKEPTT